MKRLLGLLVVPFSFLACSSGSSQPGPTYVDDVAPILGQRCATCHVEGGIAPFSLTSYAGASPVADAIKTATASRTMPPWGVDDSGACNKYEDARWLSDAEIATLAAWADAGAPEGDPSHVPPAPKTPSHLENATHHLDIGAAYSPEGTTDDYRCFVVDPGTSTDMFLTAYEVKPGDARVVHHVILYGLTDPNADQEVEALDAADPGPGYTCFGGPGASGGFSFLAGWAPGTGATIYPAGTGLPIHGGRKAVLQVHYNLASGSHPDRTTIDMHLEASVAKPALVLPLVDLDLDLPPNQASIVASHEQSVGEMATYHLLGVFPHMHLLGKSMRVERDHAGTTDCIADVPAWNFHWQQFYFYDRPIDVVTGDVARISCEYDTRSSTAEVKWGEGTKDEMCLAGFYFTKD